MTTPEQQATCGMGASFSSQLTCARPAEHGGLHGSGSEWWSRRYEADRRPASPATPTAAGQATYPLSDEGIPMCPCYGRTEVCDQPGGCTAAQPSEPPADFAAGFHAALRRQPPAEAQQDEREALLDEAYALVSHNVEPAVGWYRSADARGEKFDREKLHDRYRRAARDVLRLAARPSADTETLRRVRELAHRLSVEENDVARELYAIVGYR